MIFPVFPAVHHHHTLSSVSVYPFYLSIFATLNLLLVFSRFKVFSDFNLKYCFPIITVASLPGFWDKVGE